jgi:nitrate reductase NapE component
MTESDVTNVSTPQEARGEMQRYQIFVGIQIFFLVISLITGGFNFKVWSMLDSAILIVSIGVTGLLFVLDETSLRKTIFYTSIVLYLLAVVDMAINILISGAVGWRDL